VIEGEGVELGFGYDKIQGAEQPTQQVRENRK
jgi:hypothetical protein